MYFVLKIIFDKGCFGLTPLAKKHQFALFSRRPKQLLYLILISFSTFFAPTNLLGQEKLDTINFKPFTVVDYVIPETYTSTKIDSSAIASSENLANLLQQNSTVFIKTYSAGSLASVSFRGTGASHTKVLWNGVSLNSPMNGQIDFSLYPSFFFDAAELHHGAGGLIDGNGALGGSVLLNNNQPFASNNNLFQASFSTTVGSFGKYIQTAKASYATKNKWFIEARLYHAVAENDFDFVNIAKQNQPKEKLNFSNLSQKGFQQSMYKKFKTNTFGVRFWYFDSDRNLPPTLLTENNNESQNDQSFRTLLEWKGYFKNISYQITSSFIADKLIYNNEKSAIFSESKTKTTGLNGWLKYHLTNKISVVTKLNMQHENAVSDGFLTHKNRLNTSILTGLEGSFKKIDFAAFNRISAIENNNDFFAPTFSLGYPIPTIERLYLKTSFGINYNYPTMNDLYWNPGGNPNLVPEKATMTEVGLKFQAKQLVAELTYFYSLVDNWILWQPTANSIWSPTNLKKVENSGVEAVLNFQQKIHHFNLQVGTKYAYTKSINIELHGASNESINKQLIYVPNHQLNINTTLTYKKSSLTYNYRYTGVRYISTDNNWFLPSNYVSDVSFQQLLSLGNHQFSLRFSANNLFNKNYQSIAWRPMPQRNYLLTVVFNLLNPQRLLKRMWKSQ